MRLRLLLPLLLPSLLLRLLRMLLVLLRLLLLLRLRLLRLSLLRLGIRLIAWKSRRLSRVQSGLKRTNRPLVGTHLHAQRCV